MSHRESAVLCFNKSEAIANMKHEIVHMINFVSWIRIILCPYSEFQQPLKKPVISWIQLRIPAVSHSEIIEVHIKLSYRHGFIVVMCHTELKKKTVWMSDFLNILRFQIHHCYTTPGAKRRVDLITFKYISISFVSFIIAGQTLNWCKSVQLHLI